MAAIRIAIALLSFVQSAAFMLAPAAHPAGKSAPAAKWRKRRKRNESNVEINKYGEYRQKLENYWDAQYTALLSIGGQQVKSIIDTGSFELLVFGVDCTTCGEKRNLYDEAKSPSLLKTEARKKHNYGSGSVSTLAIYDDFAIGPFRSKNLSLWEVYDSKMAILKEGSFASIFGVGPPTSAPKFAEEDAQDLHKQLDSYKKAGKNITQEMIDVVNEYDEAAKSSWSRRSVVEDLNIQSMSVCLGRESGSPGVFIWNDTAHARAPEKFLTLNSSGSLYWSVGMTDVKFSGTAGKSSKGKKAKSTVIACQEGCTAIIDTGTSLISAPPAVAAKVESILADWSAKGGTCDDLSDLPDLQFSLDGHLLSLPPESYVGHASGQTQLLRGRANASAAASCTSLLMSMDMNQGKGKPTWILGMPFFREYYTSFIFRVGKKHNRHQPRGIAFSRADDACGPGEAPDSSSSRSLALKRQKRRGGKAKSRRARLNVDASKLLVPSVMSRRARLPENFLQQKLLQQKLLQQNLVQENAVQHGLAFSADVDSTPHHPITFEGGVALSDWIF
eukprot:TRINITY_DN57588_c0_g1_i1.p1 TRINITY_DN57588_c0_g1~~TRINITY_DN57588_c0_g1_i1.p1  ORF type:complete len:559 (-),score=128.88 TRINITY_DN57588_c0_g1_i1:75-1751(-)